MSATAASVLARGRTEIREATRQDNEGLLALTRATPMSGTISLRIDRDPDFFALADMRGETKVFVAVNDGEIVGCISGSVRSSYIGGEPERTAYVGDMKVHPRFSGSRITLRLMQALEQYGRDIGIDLCISVVAAGNQRAMPLFSGRLGVAHWGPLGQFVVKELLPLPLLRAAGRYRIEEAQMEDVPAISALLEGFYRAREFGPVISRAEIGRGIRAEGPLFSKTLVARDGSRVVATLGVLDIGPVKRNVLLNAPFSVRLNLELFRLAVTPLPRFRVPKIGDALRVITARRFACVEGHVNALRALVRRARWEAYRHEYSFVVLGLHERDPLREIVRGMAAFTFSSLPMATSLGGKPRLEKIGAGIPFEDYALV